jgi:hypothetical protein
MPYLQVDVSDHHPTAKSQVLAERMSEVYAQIMSVDIRPRCVSDDAIDDTIPQLAHRSWADKVEEEEAERIPSQSALQKTE